MKNKRKAKLRVGWGFESRIYTISDAKTNKKLFEYEEDWHKGYAMNSIKQYIEENNIEIINRDEIPFAPKNW